MFCTLKAEEGSKDEIKNPIQTTISRTDLQNPALDNLNENSPQKEKEEKTRNNVLPVLVFKSSRPPSRSQIPTKALFWKCDLLLVQLTWSQIMEVQFYPNSTFSHIYTIPNTEDYKYY